MNSIILFLKNLTTTVKRSPVEIFLCLGVFVLMQIFDVKRIFAALYFFPLYFAISYSANLMFTTVKRYLYYVSILVSIIIIFNIVFLLPLSTREVAPSFISTISAFLLIVLSKCKKDNYNFTLTAFYLCINIGTALLFTFIWTAGVWSIITAIESLFSLDTGNFMETVLQFSFFVLFPLLFMTLEKRQDQDIRPKAFNILINYILIPFIIIYAFILYTYFGKIIALWCLPKGVVAISSMIFLLSVIVVAALRLLFERKNLDIIFNKLLYFTLPAITLLWISTIYRINEYGFTGDRLYLLLTTIILTIWCVCSNFKRLNSYYHISVVSVSIYLVFTFIPYVSYYNFEERKMDSLDPAKEEIINLRIHTYGKPIMEEITDYKTIYTAFDFKEKVTNDSLEITIPDDNDVLIFKIACDDVINYILKESGIKNINAHKFAILESKDMVSYYKNKKYMIIFNSIYLKYDTAIKKIEIDNCHIKTILTQRD